MYISGFNYKKGEYTMRTYKQLTREERYQIAVLKERSLSLRSIANQMKRSVSTICREIQRGYSVTGYYPSTAHKKALERRKKQVSGRLPKIRGKLAEIIIKKVNEQWSPEQISGRLKEEHKISISHESIYQFIFKDNKCGGKLYKNLRRKRKLRRSRETARRMKNSGKRVNRKWIDDRPKIVDRRVRFGDFERDTILGRNGRGPVLLTIVDRKSRRSKIAKMERVCGVLVHEATLNLLRGVKVKTITNDNGTEFSSVWMTEKKLNTKVYFSHPYASWQRGTNENTNGLIRQYYPKGTDFKLVSDEEIKRLESLLNNRPRKCLGYKTPLEVDRNKPDVALET